MLWQSTMMNALEDDGLLEDRAPDLVALVLRTLSPVYQSDASSRKAVRAFVTAAATRHQPFLKALTGGLIKRITAASPPSAAGGSVPTLNRSDALVLLQWSSLALSLLDSTPALKKAVPRLLDSIVVLLDLLASDPAVRWPSIMRSIGAVVSKRGPTLAAECLAAAERAAGAAGGAGGAGLLRLLQDVAIAPPVNQRKRQAERRLLEGSVKLASGEVRRRQKAAAAAAAEAAAAASAAGEPAPVPAEGPAAADAPSNGNDAPHAAGAKLISDVLAVYLERALGGKERASAATLASFDQLLSTLDASAFSARVMPPLLRTLKRNPEAAMVALSDLASRVDLDLSAAGVELLPLLVQQARLKEGLRALAVEGARRVVLRVRDGAALAVMVGAVTRVLDGSAEGKVKVASERGALVLMLTVLGEASAEVAAVAAPKAVAFLLAFYKDEIAEDVRVALLGALGVWLPCCGAAPPAAAVALLAAGVRDTKEGLRRAHLRAAVAALKSCPAMAAHLAPLVEGCSKNVADGCGKALLRLDGVLSLAVAAQVAAMDPAAAATLDKDKVWAMCLKADSALLAPATAAKFAPADAAAAAQLAATLLLHFSSKLAKADGLGSSTFSGVSGGFRPVPGPTRPPFRANDAERANLPPNPPPPFTPLTIPPAPTLLSPLLNPTKKTHTHPASASAVVTLITGPLGLHSAHPPDNAAATLALGAAMSASPTALYPHVGAALATLLDRVEHDALTEHDLEVASTPEGMLCSERVAEGTYIPEVVENKNVKKARGRMRSGARAFAEDSSSDDEPAAAAKKPAAAAAAAAAVRPSQAASAASAGRGAGGAIKKSSTSREEAVRAMKMSQEAQTRSKVRSIRATLELGLAALSAVVAGNPTFAAQHLEDFEALAMPLMSSGLVGAPAFNAIRSLSTCLPGRLGLHSMFVAASLRLVVLAQRGARGNSYGDIAGKAAVADVVHALTQVVTVPKRRLPSSSYCFVFPVLEAVLSSPQHTPLHEEALSVVSLHCSAAGGDIPRAASLGLLYHLLGVIPAYRSAHRRAMTAASHPAAGADTHTSRRPVVRPSPGGRHQPRAAAVTSAVADPFLWHRAWAEAVPSRYTPAVGETHPASMRPRHRGVPAPACARASLGGVAHRRPPRPVSRANPWSASQTPPPPAIGSLQRSAHAPAHTWSVLPSERLEDA
ncbi:MAG: hypothetical protein WDW36_006532 [Sanguina aurantia]